MDGELAVLGRLKERGVAVAGPVARRDGQLKTTVQAPEGARELVLYEGLRGSRLVPSRDAKEYGVLAGQLHVALDGLQLPFQRNRLDVAGLMEDSFEPVLAVLHNGTELRDYFVGLQGRVRERAAELGLADLPRGICHGDLNFANCVRLDSGGLGLYDFECCGPGILAYDLAVFRWTQKLVGAAPEVWDEFVSGYSSTRPLGEAERRAVDLLVLLRQAWVIGHDAKGTLKGIVGTRWYRVGRTRNLDTLRRLDSEVFGTPAMSPW